jgi:HEAT repeat protein
MEAPMARALIVLTVLFLAVFSVPARAADDDPKVGDRTLSQWLEMLEGTREVNQRRLGLQALGAAADHSLIWREMTNRRSTALVVVDFVGPAKNKLVLPAMAAALRNDPEPVVRAAAAQSLGKMSAKCRTAKQDFGPGRDALFTAVRTDPSGAVREAAVRALGQLDPGEIRPAVAALIDRLKDDYPDVRTAAAATLFKLGRDAVEAVPALREVVQDVKNDRTMRVWAVHALGKIGTPEASEALPTLQKVLEDDKTPLDIRTAIVEELGNFGKDASPTVPVLAKLLTDDGSSIEIRNAVVTALEKLGPDAKAALPALKKVSRDRDKFIRGMALRALGRIGKELGPDVKEVAALLRQGTDDPLLDVRLAAIETLGNLGAEVLGSELAAVRERLQQLTESGDKDVREAAQTALKKLES